MATKVVMPQLGESVTEGTLSKWLVSVGDTVNKYDPLAEVNTDKVNAEIPSTVSGKIAKLLIAEGDTVAVGTPILYIEESGAVKGGVTGGETAAQAEKPVGIVEQKPVTPAPAAISPTAADQEPTIAVSMAGLKQRYSPAVMRLAQEHNIDLGRVTGTGAEGRITRKDVQAIIDQGGRKSQDQVFAEPALAANATHPEPMGRVSDKTSAALPTALASDQVIPVSAVRKTIASRLVQSKQEIPHAWMMVEADVTNLVAFRNQVKDEFQKKEGIALTYLPFFIKAVVEALKEYPMINSTWAGDHIILRKDVNISLAVATEDALFVPVIKEADQKSLFGIAKAVDDLAKRTRAGKLTVDDMSGGTFTVNNTGSFGSVQSAPIINAPQAAILSIEAIVKRPVVISDMIAIRSMVNLCLSLDHRVLDGLVCGRFLQSVKQKLEAIGPDTHLY